MDFAHLIQQLQATLLAHRPLWQQDLLEVYPQGLDHYPRDWIAYLAGASLETQWRVWQASSGLFPPESRRAVADHPEFRDFLEHTHRLQQLVPRCAVAPPADLPPSAFFRVKGKKRHEIERLRALILDLHRRHRFGRVVDVGGGMGHLSRILAQHHDLPCLTLDRDRRLLARGQDRSVRSRDFAEGSAVEFRSLILSEASEPAELAEVFAPDALCLGLHCCGDLSNQLIRMVIRNRCRGLVSFGCCYEKMDPARHLNRSAHGRARPFPFTEHSLALATWSHARRDHASYLEGRKVKEYRYAFHLLMLEELGMRPLIQVGRSGLAAYQGDFSAYALAQLAYNGIEHRLSAAAVDGFFHRKSTRQQLDDLLASQLIKCQFNRLIEILIQADRGLWLQENGYQVTLNRCFDEEISPRNIGIVAVAPD